MAKRKSNGTGINASLNERLQFEAIKRRLLSLVQEMRERHAPRHEYLHDNCPGCENSKILSLTPSSWYSHEHDLAVFYSLCETCDKVARHGNDQEKAGIYATIEQNTLNAWQSQRVKVA